LLGANATRDLPFGVTSVKGQISG